MPLAWVMQSCSICSLKVFGWRRSDSFPEHVLWASQLPELAREAFKQISNLSGYESTCDWQRDADVMTIGQVFEWRTFGGGYVHHWDENIANSTSVLFGRFDQFLEIQDMLRLLDPHDFYVKTLQKRSTSSSLRYFFHITKQHHLESKNRQFPIWSFDPQMAHPSTVGWSRWD